MISAKTVRMIKIRMDMQIQRDVRLKSTNTG